MARHLAGGASDASFSSLIVAHRRSSPMTMLERCGSVTGRAPRSRKQRTSSSLPCLTPYAFSSSVMPVQNNQSAMPQRCRSRGGNVTGSLRRTRRKTDSRRSIAEWVRPRSPPAMSSSTLDPEALHSRRASRARWATLTASTSFAPPVAAGPAPQLLPNLCRSGLCLQRRQRRQARECRQSPA